MRVYLPTQGSPKVHQEYQGRGFEVLGFPSNSFYQEPLGNKKIKNFCESKYGVNFTVFEKMPVVGQKKSPVYRFLVGSAVPKKEVSWNFEKFLLNRDGLIVKRYASRVNPASSEVKKISNIF